MADHAKAEAPAVSTHSKGYISNPFELIRPSFEALKVNLGTLVVLVITVVAILLFGAMAVLAAIGFGQPVVAVILGLLLLVGMFYFAPASILIMMHSARGKKVSLSAVLGEGRPFVVRMLGLGILTALAIVGGLLLFVVPGLVFIAWFSLANYVMIDENLGPVDAMKRSKQLVSGRVVEMWGLIGLSQAFGLLTIVPVLGAIAAFVLGVIYAPATAIRYDQLKDGKAADGKPHAMNYLAIILAILSLGTSFAMTPKDAQDNSSQSIDSLFSS